MLTLRRWITGRPLMRHWPAASLYMAKRQVTYNNSALNYTSGSFSCSNNGKQMSFFRELAVLIHFHKVLLKCPHRSLLQHFTSEKIRKRHKVLLPRKPGLIETDGQRIKCWLHISTVIRIWNSSMNRVKLTQSTQSTAVVLYLFSTTPP